MDPAIAYFAFGLTAAVSGSFVAARLLRIDRLWIAGERLDIAGLIERIVLVAEQAGAGRSALRSMAAGESHPLLRTGLELLAKGEAEGHLRRRLDRELARAERIDRRTHAVGRLLAALAPTLGIAGMTGSMFIAIQRLEDPTRSSSALALALVMLMVGSSLINAFTKRIPRPHASTVAEGLLAGGLVIEGIELIARQTPAADVQARLYHLAGLAMPAAARKAA